MKAVILLWLSLAILLCLERTHLSFASQPASPAPSGKTSTVAQVTATVAPYPAPDETVSIQEMESPEPSPPYPAELNPIGSDSAPPAPFGHSEESGADTVQQTQGSDRNARILLWLGFVGALLVFIGGVFFSILLSTRERQGASRK